MQVQVFNAKIVKMGTNKVVDKLSCLALSLFQADHIFTETIYSEESKYDYPVEIASIKRVKSVSSILNPEFILDMDEDKEDSEHGYDPELPYTIASNLPDSNPRIMTFKCSCKEDIRVHNGDWLYIECHNCHNKIYRREIEEVGGKYIFVRLDDRKQ